MEKVLTIVIPVYNMEKYIRHCLDSFVVEDILDKIEVLIILDGSTDHSGEIAQKYSERYPGTFHVIEKENGGHGSTINAGVEKAAGTYLKVVDSDDWVDPGAFRNLVLFLEKTDVDVVWSNYYWCFEQSHKMKYQTRHPFRGVKYGKVYAFSKIADRTFIKMHSMTIRTDILRKCGRKLDEHCYYVDVEFVMYPIPWVKTIVFLDEFVYMYRLGRPGQSMTLEKMRQNHRNHERVLKSLLDFYKDTLHSGTGKAWLLYLEKGIANVLSSHFKIYLSFPCSKKVHQELKQMDQNIRKEYPRVYRKVRNAGVWAIRLSDYLLYYAGHFGLKLREKKYEL